MVYYALYWWADLDNLTNLQPRYGCDDPTYPYYFKVRVLDRSSLSSPPPFDLSRFGWGWC